MKQLEAARTLISREFDICRKPDVARIAESTGLQHRTVEVLVDEVRAARQQPRPTPPTGTGTKPRVTPDGEIAAIELAWLGHPSPKARRAAERAYKAIQAAIETIAAEGSIELWKRREQLRAQRAKADAELAALDAKLGAAASTECPDCGAKLRKNSNQAKAIHAARSKQHQAAIARKAEKEATE